jgi:parvulin-like peptidyl-prolyl isomerase
MSALLSSKARALLAALLLAALGTLVAGCGGGGSAAELSGEDVATVGRIHIAKARFDAQLELARASYKAQGREFPTAGTPEFEAIKAQAMALLVQAAARELKAESLGIEVTKADVDKELVAIKKQYFDGDDKKYRAEVARLGLTDAEVREQTKTQLISRRVSEQLTAGVTVTDQEISEYYEARKSEERPVSYILVGKDKEQLARQIHAQLKKGADFAALAKRHSQDDSSSDQGGKLTAVKGQVVPEFERVVFALEPGELAEPFETPEYGWFVVRADTVKEASAGLRQKLLEERRNESMTEWLEEAAESVCSDGAIAYQIGYVPNPDPCAQFTATTPTVPEG